MQAKIALRSTAMQVLASESLLNKRRAIARYYQVPFGNFVDPFGEPVKRAFALYPAAARPGRGIQYVTAYLDAAFANGTDITNNEGLSVVAGEITRRCEH